MVHGTGDAAFHGEPLVIEGSHVDDPAAGQRRCCTVRSRRRPASAAGRGPRAPGWAPARRSRRRGLAGRPSSTSTGSTPPCRSPPPKALWYGSFRTAPGRVVLVKDPGSAQAYDLGLFTLDTSAGPAAIAERYSWRWPIEPSNAAGKQVLGVGDACNRVEKAVERTVPFGFLIQTLLITWYARAGYHPGDISRRRLLCPWYRTKNEPAAADMLGKLRREFLKARFSAIPARPGPA